MPCRGELVDRDCRIGICLPDDVRSTRQRSLGVLIDGVHPHDKPDYDAAEGLAPDVDLQRVVQKLSTTANSGLRFSGVSSSHRLRN